MQRILFISAIFLSLGLSFTACSGNDNKIKTGQLAKGEMYTCTMHNEVMSYHAGECPKCGMKLVNQKMTTDQEKMMKESTYTKPKQ